MYLHEFLLGLVYAYAGVYTYFKKRYGVLVALPATAILPTAVVAAIVVALFQLT